MTDFKYADFQPYEQNLWHAPTIKSQGLWHESSYKFGTIPEPLYRLRLSVLNNNQGRDDCPSRIYVRSVPISFLLAPRYILNDCSQIYIYTGLSDPRNVHERHQRDLRLIRRLLPQMQNPIRQPPRHREDDRRSRYGGRGRCEDEERGVAV